MKDPGQLSFPGFSPDAPPTDGLFFAILPDSDTARKIGWLARELKRMNGLTGKLLAADRLHISLYLLGEGRGIREDLATSALEAAALIKERSFDVTFDRVGSFVGRPGGRPLVLRSEEGVVELKRFREALGSAMMKAGLRPEGRSFTPHVTLLYDDRLLPEQRIGPVRWTVKEFVLIHSLLGQSRYIRVGRWPLRD